MHGSKTEMVITKKNGGRLLTLVFEDHPGRCVRTRVRGLRALDLGV